MYVLWKAVQHSLFIKIVNIVIADCYASQKRDKSG